MLPADTRVLADPEAVAIEACRLISAAAAAAITQRRIFRLVLAGGTTPGRIYQRRQWDRQSIHSVATIVSSGRKERNSN